MHNTLTQRPVLPAMPYFREAGSGPGVVCIHCNASSASQWRPLMDRLAPGWHVMAPDTHGAGRGPAWPTDRMLELRDEVDLLESVFAHAGAPFALVGHSYGGAVALLAALRHRERVHALVLYEPTLFALIDAASPPPNAADGIRKTVALSAAALAASDPNAAAKTFIDYWMGAGAWSAKPAAQQKAIAAAIVHVAGWGAALFGETTPLAALQTLEMPVLLMLGSETTLAARAVALLLARSLPRVELVHLDGLGHMGPVTDPQRVDAVIEDFLQRHCVNPAS